MSSITTFGVFGDMHYARDGEASLCCSASLGKIGRAMERFREGGARFVVSLGDAITGGRGEEEDRDCVRTVKELLCSSGFELRCVLGNHDLKGFTKAEVVAEWGECLPSPYYSWDAEGIRFVVLDGNCHEDGSDFERGEFDWADAWISGEQVAWLREVLAEAQGRPAIVFCHENLDDRETAEGRDIHVVGNASDVRAVMERSGNVKAVIQGHYHLGMHTVINGIPYVVITSLVAGPEEDRPAGAVVSLHEDGALTVEGFGRQESWEWRP
ncbi:MAG: metallophosphoesterase [Lentisphaerae bacterium]|nr:metallophosphoesterase [Lentisphaerota bacterium]